MDRAYGQSIFGLSPVLTNENCLAESLTFVDSIPNEEGIHSIGDTVYINTTKSYKHATFEIGSYIARIVVILALHQLIVGGNKSLNCTNNDGTKF